MSKKEKRHYYVIDVLKAFSALTVIWLHVSNYYKSDSAIINTIWVWSHFAVGVFVASSGFLQGIKPFVIEKARDGFAWLWKRVKRLLGPYYVFFFVYAILILLLPDIFDGRPFELNVDFILSSVLLHGGLGGNWIPRIFVLLAVLHLVFENFTQKFGKGKYYVPLIVSLSISFWFFLDEPDSFQKYNQVFTWYALFLYGLLLCKNYKNRRFVWISLLISSTITIGCALYLSSVGRTTSIFQHKYPPTLYFVAYNALITAVLFIISPKSLPVALRPIVSWISQKSYAIFFVHLIVIDAIGNIRYSLPVDYLITTSITLIVVYIWDKFVRLFSPPIK